MNIIYWVKRQVIAAFDSDLNSDFLTNWTLRDYDYVSGYVRRPIKENTESNKLVNTLNLCFISSFKAKINLWFIFTA